MIKAREKKPRKAEEVERKRRMEQARRLDFITRAMRKEELPKLFEKSRKEIESELKREKDAKILAKRRCEKMFSFRLSFEEAVEKVGYGVFSCVFVDVVMCVKRSQVWFLLGVDGNDEYVCLIVRCRRGKRCMRKN